MRSRTWLAVLLALALVVAACGDDDSGDAGTGTGDDSTATTEAGDETTETTAAGDATTAPETTAAGDASGIDPEGVLRLAGFGSTTSFDPHLASSTFDITRLALTYDRLLHTTPDGGLVAGLATEWGWNEDATRLDMTLREGVTFHDGTPFDAEAVKANLERAKTLEGSTVAAELASVESVEVVDPTHVSIVLTQPDAPVLASLSDRAGAMISPAAMDNPDLDVAPVGAGMFVVSEHRPDDVTIYEPYEDYWDPDAIQVASIEAYAIADPVPRVNALLTGEIDIAPIDPADVDRVESADGVEVRLNETLRFLYLGLNKARGPLGEPDVRKAISMAIDRQALVDAIWFGLGTVSEQPWPEGYLAHNPDIPPDYYPYDPDAARQLLVDAGYPDGFPLEVISVPQPEAYAQLAEAIQAQLAEIGIDMTVRITEPAQLGQVFLVDQEGDGALLYTNGKLDPAGTVAERYTPTGFLNPGGYTTDTLMSLYEQSVAETDPDARADIFQQISTEVVDQVLDVVLFHPIEPEGVSDRVVGYEAYLSGKPEYRGVGVTG